MNSIVPQKKIKSYCNNCKCWTNHSILFSKIIGSDDNPVSEDYQTLECMGCESIAFRIETTDANAVYQDEYGDMIDTTDVKLYPVPFDHKPIRETYFLPPKIQIVYQETISCLKSNSFLLAGVGFRTLIEAVCNDKSVSGTNLEDKIKKLLEKRFITDKEADRLHAIRFMGNDSVHDMNVSSKKALYIVLEIVEHLLNNLYLIDKHTGSVLDTMIETQEEFEKLLKKRLKNFEEDADLSLKEYFTKDIRRLNQKLPMFENGLIENINSGAFKGLVVGERKKSMTNSNEYNQHFIKITNSDVPSKSLRDHIKMNI